MEGSRWVLGGSIAMESPRVDFSVGAEEFRYLAALFGSWGLLSKELIAACVLMVCAFSRSAALKIRFALMKRVRSIMV